jgi:hypothetical protein
MGWRIWGLLGVQLAIAAGCGGTVRNGSGDDGAGATGSGGKAGKSGTGGPGMDNVPLPAGGSGFGGPTAGGAVGFPTAGTSATAGAGQIPSLPGNIKCQQPSLNVPWPVVGTCEPGDNTLTPGFQETRCPFSKHLTDPAYGAFVACCPPDRPYSCANSTPWQCFATPNQAAASCGVQECVACSDWPPPAVGGAPGTGDAGESAGGYAAGGYASGGEDSSAGYGGVF